MRFSIVTLFPEMFDSVLGASLLGKAIDTGLIEVAFIDPREFTQDRHRTVDDAPYGGGPGMVMKAEPLVAAIEAAAERGAQRGWPVPHRVLLSPAGRRMTQDMIPGLSEQSHILLVCGRYEGIDDRVARTAIDEEISIGDYVLTGGELAAMAVVDAVSRYVPGVLGDAASVVDESHASGLLEYPQYTRPQSYRGMSVPAELTSGNHERVRRFRRQQALTRTAQRRPDLLKQYSITAEDRQLLADSGGAWEARTYVALAHYPVYDKAGDVVTSSITNMDLHDLARTATTYGLAGYFVVTPIAAQREKVDRIVETWRDGDFGDNREQALAAVTTSPSLADVYTAIAERHGRPAMVVATSAQSHGEIPTVGFNELARARAADPAPTCLVFGTGWGLAAAAMETVHSVLTPISGRTDFNHLCVRSAAAIVIDRLFGQCRVRDGVRT